MYLLPLVVLPLPLRLAEAKILEPDRMFLSTTQRLPRICVGVVSVVTASIAFAVHCKLRFVKEVLVPQTS